MLRNRERRGGAFGERRCLVDICDTDRDKNAIAAAVAIRDIHLHRVGRLTFIVQRSPGFQLTGRGNNIKRLLIRTPQSISECVVVRIGCSDRTADVSARHRILRDGARRAIAIRKDRRAV